MLVTNNNYCYLKKNTQLKCREELKTESEALLHPSISNRESLHHIPDSMVEFSQANRKRYNIIRNHRSTVKGKHAVL